MYCSWPLFRVLNDFTVISESHGILVYYTQHRQNHTALWQFADVRLLKQKTYSKNIVQARGNGLFILRCLKNTFLNDWFMLGFFINLAGCK